MISHHEDIEQTLAERRKRWQAFMDPDSQDAPPFLFIIQVLQPDQPEPVRPPLWPDLVTERIEWAWQMYQYRRQRCRWLDDDYLPYLAPRTGTEVFPEAFGCPVHRPDHTNPFAQPVLRSASQAEKLTAPSCDAGPLATVFEIADALRQRGGQDALLALPDIASPMGNLSLIWEKTDLLITMVENPDLVHHARDIVFGLLMDFLDEWRRRYGNACISHYPEYFMPEGVTFSEDEVGSVSPEMFREFFAPSHRRLAQRYGSLGIHCCADSRHQWENFRNVPALAMLNLVTPHKRSGAEFIGDSNAFFADTCALYPQGWPLSDDPAAWWPSVPDGARIVFELQAKTPAQARQLAEKMNKLRGSVTA